MTKPKQQTDGGNQSMRKSGKTSKADAGQAMAETPVFEPNAAGIDIGA
jgi:hypothetical protein